MKSDKSTLENQADAGTAPATSDQAVLEQVATLDLGTISADQFQELKERAAKADDYWDRMLRVTADFDNFRKRAAREKQEAIRFANEGLLEKLVPVLDNFDMALTATQTAPGNAAQSLQTGVSMIFQQFKQVLTDSGLEEIDAAGQMFDPNLHEAVSQREAADVPEGQVVQQLRKGYKLRERLLRPATVIVAKNP
jgi:molecular chaperone GrpE